MRLEVFPERIRRFWAEHYVAYRGAVLLAGTSIVDSDPRPTEFEVLVPGAYAFYPSNAHSSIRVGNSTLAQGDTVWLENGYLSIDNSDVIGSALFVLAVPTPPGRNRDTFYRGF